MPDFSFRRMVEGEESGYITAFSKEEAMKKLQSLTGWDGDVLDYEPLQVISVNEVKELSDEPLELED